MGEVIVKDEPMPTWTLDIPRWHPSRLNELMGCHWGKRSRLKRADRQTVALLAKLPGIPKAPGPRRVSLRIVLKPRQRASDPDAYWKSTLNALVSCGLLLDDDRQTVELG
jgi:hypothetical protein